MIPQHHPALEFGLNSILTLQHVMYIVFGCSLLGLIWATVNYLSIRTIDMDAKNRPSGISQDQHRLVIEIGEKIAQGAQEFLKQEYLICFVFIIIMFITIYGAVEQFKTAYTAFAFLIGALTSMLCGLIGMAIATYTNYRVAYCAKKGLADAFRTAYRGGTVMGFALVSLALLSKEKIIQHSWQSFLPIRS